MLRIVKITTSIETRCDWPDLITAYHVMKIWVAQWEWTRWIFAISFTLVSRLEWRRWKVAEGEDDKRHTAVMTVSERTNIFMSLALI